MLRWIAITLSICLFGLACGAAQADEPLHRAIDRLVTARLGSFKVTQAAERSSDTEFVRRLSLDLTGVIPRPDVFRAFVADAAVDKRTRLIDRLLDSDEHARHFATVFDVLLMERRPDKHVSTHEWRGYLSQSFRDRKPLDTLIHELLDSDGVEAALRPAAKFYLDREVATDVLVRDLGRLFLGIDLQCAQCHDHPSINDYRHTDYYGLQAFLQGIKTFKQPDGTMVLQENLVREVSFASVFEPSKAKKTGPRLPGGELVAIPEFKAGDEYLEKPSSKVRAVPKFSLRHVLAESLPRQENKLFARNLANRLWAQLLGLGLVYPLDLHHAHNPASHPELLDLLSERLVAMKFDSRAFLRELALSETYQRSSLASVEVDPNDVPAESYALANLKGLSPEQLFESLVLATHNEVTLERQIDAALASRSEAEREKLDADASLRLQARSEERAKRVAEFAELFGGPAGTPDPEFQPSLPQALYLANSSSIAAWLAPQHDNLAARLEKQLNASRLAETLYESILSRSPTSEEVAQVEKHLQSKLAARSSAVQALIWSLLASSEFRLNH